MRREDWAARLRAAFAAAERLRFRYGPHDCARFAAGCVAAILTEPPILPEWHDARSAGAVVGSGNLVSAIRAAAERNGWPEISPRFAMAGDLVYLADRSRFGGAAGIVDLSGRQARFASDRGTALVGITKLDLAWRV